MRGFILIAFFAAASVSGRPEAPGGYNYNQPQQQQSHHHAAPQQSYAAPQQSYAAPQQAYAAPQQSYAAPQQSYAAPQQSYAAPQQSYAAPQQSQGGYAAAGAAPGYSQGPAQGGYAAAGAAPGYSQGPAQGGYSGGGHSGGGHSGGGQAGPAQTIVQKHIYVHVPPPEDEAEAHHAQQQQVAPRKHYKIIFIKAPSTAPQYSPAAQQAIAQSQEKTLIYVLVKKPEEANFDAAPQAGPAAPVSKPEVYFIKYKTQKEQGGSGFASGSAAGDFSAGASDFASNPQSSYGPPHKK